MPVFEQLLRSLRLSSLFVVFLTLGAGFLFLEYEGLRDPKRWVPLTYLSTTDRPLTGTSSQAINYSNPSQDRLILFFGGSSLREAIETSEGVQKEMSMRFNEDIRFLSLGSSSQSLYESYSLLSYFQLNPGDIVYMAVNLVRVRGGWQSQNSFFKRPILPFLQSDHVLGVLKDNNQPYERSLTISHLPYVLKKTKDYLLSANHSKMHRYPDSALENSVKQGLIYKDEVFDPTYQLDTSAAYVLLKSMQDYVESHGAQLVLIDLPQDPLRKTLFTYVEDEYRSFFSKLSQEGVVYIDLNAPQYYNVMNLNSSDFYDVSHMTKNGREKFLTAFLDLTADYIEGKEN